MKKNKRSKKGNANIIYTRNNICVQIILQIGGIVVIHPNKVVNKKIHKKYMFFINGDNKDEERTRLAKCLKKLNINLSNLPKGIIALFPDFEGDQNSNDSNDRK